MMMAAWCWAAVVITLLLTFGDSGAHGANVALHGLLAYFRMEASNYDVAPVAWRSQQCSAVRAMLLGVLLACQ